MNRYSPFVFLSLLVIPLLCCTAQAQDNTASNAGDPFDRMFSQAREQERQKIIEKFAQAQQNSPTPFANSAGSTKNPYQQNLLPQDPSKSASVSANPLSANPASPSSNIPVPSANSTNTGTAPPANIYVPPSPPPAAAQSVAQPPTQAPQSAARLPQSSTNIYG